MNRSWSFVFGLIGAAAGGLVILLAWHLYQDHLLVDQIRQNSQQQLLQAAEQIKQQQARPAQ